MTVVLPPHSLEAERAVLGGVFIDASALDDIAGVLRPTDFYRDGHAHIFDAMLALYARKERPDPLTVFDLLKARGLDKQAGDDPGALIDMMQQTPSAANVEHYARIVREKAQLRRFAAVTLTEGDAARRGTVGGDVTDFLTGAEARIHEAVWEGDTSGPVLIVEPGREALARVERIARNKEPAGLSTGLQRIDDVIAGMKPGNLVVLAARPGIGKTSLALAMAAHAAEHSGPVVFFSLEMTREELALRLVSIRSRVPVTNMTRGTVPDWGWDAIGDAVTWFDGIPLYVDDAAGLTALDVRSRSRRVARRAEKRPALIVVDYVQLLRPHVEGNREREVAEMSRELKALAKELRSPVLAVAQLNRDVERRKGSACPQLSDLRDSGQLEQDADLVLFLWRHRNSDPVVQATVAKHRNGPTGTVELGWDRETMRFSDVADMEPGRAPYAE